MAHKPGFIDFKETIETPNQGTEPKALVFEKDSVDSEAMNSGPASRTSARQPATLFNDVTISPAPALEYVRKFYPIQFEQHGSSLEARIKKLANWSLETVAAWSGKHLHENASIASQITALLTHLSSYGVNELVKKALEDTQSLNSGLLTKLFSKSKILSYKPRLMTAKHQLFNMVSEMTKYESDIGQVILQIQLDLISLVAAYETLPKPTMDDIQQAIFTRRVLLQQALQQGELIDLQVKEVIKNSRIQLDTIERLLMVTIPSFELANAQK